MTEQPREFVICQQCGGKNLPFATRCVHCGSTLDVLFTVEGSQAAQAPQPTENEESDDLLQILENLHSGEAFRDLAPENSGDTPADSADTRESGQASSGLEEETPEWLQRIRQRALREDDASGNLVKPSRPAGDAAEPANASAIDREFNDWIARIREKAQREASRQARLAAQSAAEAEDGTPAWLRRVRALQPGDDPASPEEQGRAGHPGNDWAVEWTPEALEALRRREQEKTDEITAAVDQPSADENATLDSTEQIETLPAALPAETSADHTSQPTELAPEETQAVPVVKESQSAAAEQEPAELLPEGSAADSDESPLPEPATASQKSAESNSPNEAGVPEGSAQPTEEETEQPKQTGELPADLVLLRSQQESAELLRRLIGLEGKPSRLVRKEQPAPSTAGRLVAAALLLLGLIAAIIFTPAQNIVPSEPLPAPAAAFAARTAQLEPADRVLILLDYQPAVRVEMEQALLPVLNRLTDRGVTWQLAALHPAGVWLGAELTRQSQNEQPVQTEFLPGGQFTLLAWAAQVQPEWELPRLIPAGLGNLPDYAAIILAGDSESGLRAWMEQAGPWLKDSDTLLVSARQLSALALPYYDSGQLSGMITVLDPWQGTEAGFLLGTSYRAYQAGILIMLVLLLLGMIIKAEHDANLDGKEKQP